MLVREGQFLDLQIVLTAQRAVDIKARGMSSGLSVEAADRCRELFSLVVARFGGEAYAIVLPKLSHQGTFSDAIWHKAPPCIFQYRGIVFNTRSIFP